MKRFITLLIVLLLVSVNSFAAGNDFSVDFSSSTGFGISSERFQINNINVDFSAVNPLTGEATVINQVVNVVWQWDQQGVCLRPVSVAGSDDTSTCTGNLEIKVTNALTGSPISGATVTIGNQVQTTDEDGTAHFLNLSEGNVQVNVVASGYLPQDTAVAVVCNEDTGAGVSLLPANDQGVAQGDIRIVLTWGENPEDLDSHLTGPMAGSSDVITTFPPMENTNRFHIYYAEPNNCDGSPCDTSIPAWLDVDDTTSYGPETITITKINGNFIPGRYRYSVHHYSGSGNIATSGAVVKVFQGSQLLRTFYPPTNAPADLGVDWVWTVFELNILPDGSLSIAEVGTYQGPVYDNDMNAFSSVKTYLGVPVYSENPELFKNLPPKK